MQARTRRRGKPVSNGNNSLFLYREPRQQTTHHTNHSEEISTYIRSKANSTYRLTACLPAMAMAEDVNPFAQELKAYAPQLRHVEDTNDRSQPRIEPGARHAECCRDCIGGKAFRLRTGNHTPAGVAPKVSNKQALLAEIESSELRDTRLGSLETYAILLLLGPADSRCFSSAHLDPCA